MYWVVYTWASWENYISDVLFFYICSIFNSCLMLKINQLDREESDMFSSILEEQKSLWTFYIRDFRFTIGMSSPNIYKSGIKIKHKYFSTIQCLSAHDNRVNNSLCIMKSCKNWTLTQLLLFDSFKFKSLRYFSHFSYDGNILRCFSLSSFD